MFDQSYILHSLSFVAHISQEERASDMSPTFLLGKTLELSEQNFTNIFPLSREVTTD